MPRNRLMRHFAGLVLLSALALTCSAQSGKAHPNETASNILRVGLAGSEPFVVYRPTGFEGISVEIWQAVADQTGTRYRFQHYDSVPEALSALMAGAVDAVVGPVSVTASRARIALFSQPYFQSSLSILSGTEEQSIWQRTQPFFSIPFFVAIAFLMFVLVVVGTLIWLAERRVSENEFPDRPITGIGNGVWLAIVTMTTVGYGDRVPKTFLGRLVTGTWMIISLITATSLIAGITTTLTLSGMRANVVSSAEQLNKKKIAVEANSPGEEFARRYGAQVLTVTSIQQAYELIGKHQANAMVFDRPQLLYFISQQHGASESVSKAEYDRQAYAFAFSMASQLVHNVNISLLRLEESGRVDRIVKAWLGDQAQQ